ncbi:MAG: hypothetical protein KDA77_13840, partial [Planctomycetaceae bacterium]|nr:hypothetical protein [Planctomycetaceae bacterium]
YEIDTLMEDRLNQLAESTLSDTEAESDDFDWNSSDLLSFGDEIEAIEIGADSEVSAEIEVKQHKSEPVKQSTPVADLVPEKITRSSLNAEWMNAPVTSDGFIEIIDRYAAIDAGIDPATLPRETRPKSEPIRPSLQLRPPRFHASVKQDEFRPKQNIVPPGESAADHKSESDSIVFEESQLKRLEPNVFQALAKEIAQDDGSFEELLAAQVYEVCSETRRGLLNALHEIRNYAESLETEAPEEETVTYDMVEPEYAPSAGTSFRLDAQPEPGQQSSATAHLKGPAFGRYKNLFTRLRRKQGLN